MMGAIYCVAVASLWIAALLTVEGAFRIAAQRRERQR